MKKIILISGKAENGKDTVAKILKDILESKGSKVAITHYAIHIKNMLREFYNWNGIKNDWARNKLQWLGTDKIRIEKNMMDFHVNRTCEDIDFVQDDFDYFIIADCRFQNEIEYIEKYFGKDKVITIRVTRLNYESTLTTEAQNHPSETALDNWNNWNYHIMSVNNDWNGLETQCSVIAEKII